MSSRVPPPSIFKFGMFELDVRTGELRKYGLRIRIARPALKVLVKLLQRPGKLFTREELGGELIPSGSCGDLDCSLNKAIYQLRRALGDSASSPRYIETFATQGYRFIPLAENGDQHPAHMRRPPRLNSIAVLPLASEAVEPELGFVGGQVVFRLINKLSSTPRVRVLAYSTVKHYSRKESDPQTIGRNLGVQGVLMGEILRHDENAIFELELIATTDGAHVWGLYIEERWPVASSGGTDRIVEQIVRELQPILAHSRKPVGLDRSKPDEAHPSAA
jgi:DNA-binding winged helix-turn-helix (wHTH) protein